jgi:fructoselysine-6-P-deglycase FrlB-like protein
MLRTEHELRSQPRIWLRAAAVASAAADRLPPRGARLAIIGCGTSFYIAQAMAGLREAAGHGETDAFAASEAPLARGYDAILAVSRSGTTTEVCRALENVPPRTTTIAICGAADSPLPDVVEHAVVLDFADERSVVQTRFATSALALLRAQLGHPIQALSAAADEVLRLPLPDGLENFEQLVFLGAGWGVGIANESGLKLREAAGAWTEAYPAMEYRHGPISAATDRTLVWAVGPVDGDVLSDAGAAGATVVDSGRDPMVELVLIQRAAVALAVRRGLDPDEPRNLSRSVVLQATGEGAEQ